MTGVRSGVFFDCEQYCGPENMKIGAEDTLFKDRKAPARGHGIFQFLFVAAVKVENRLAVYSLHLSQSWNCQGAVKVLGMKIDRYYGFFYFFGRIIKDIHDTIIFLFLIATSSDAKTLLNYTTASNIIHGRNTWYQDDTSM